MVAKDLEMLAQLALNQRMGQLKVLDLLGYGSMHNGKLRQNMVLMRWRSFFYAVVHKMVKLLHGVLILLVTPFYDLIHLILNGLSLVLSYLFDHL